MRNILYCLIILLLAPLAGRGQNAVFLARTLDSLHQRTAACAPGGSAGYQPKLVIELGREFFQQLVSNGTSQYNSVASVREQYRQNPFLASVVDQEYGWFERALLDQAKNIANAPTRELASVQQSTQQLYQLLLAPFKTQLQQKPDSALRADLGWQHLYAASLGKGSVGNPAEYPPGWAAAAVGQLNQALTARLKPYKDKARGDSIPATLAASLLAQGGPAGQGRVLNVADSLLGQADRTQIASLYQDLRRSYTQLNAVVAGALVSNRRNAELSREVVAQTISQRGPLLVPTLSLLPSVGLPVLRELGPASPPPAGAPLTAEGALLNGTTAFLADRLKQELNATFFQRFATLLHDSAYVELQLLFPATARLLTSGSADYGTVVQTLRGTFEQDLRELLFNYADLLAHEKFYGRSIPANTASGQLLRYAYVVTRAHGYLLRGTHPADLLERLQPDLDRAEFVSKEFKATLRLAQVLSGAVTSDDPLQRQWLPTAVVVRTLRPPVRQQLFLGLVWERARAQDCLSLRLRHLPSAQQRAEFQQAAANFLALSTRLGEQVEALRKKAAAGRLGAEEFVPLYQTIQQGIDFGRVYADTYVAPGPPHLPDAKSKQYEDLANLCRRIGDDLMQGYVAADKGDYGVTLSHFLNIVLLTLAPAGSPAIVLPVGTSPAESAGALLRQLPQPANSQLLNLPQLVRYGAFMAAVAQARNATDVKAALEAAALPSGSASIKRRSFTSLSVNAFVGVTAGAEWAYDARVRPVSDEASLRFAVGPTAPIGVSVAWGCRGLVRDRRSAVALAAATQDAGRKATAATEAQRRKQARLRRLDQAYRYYDEQGKERYLRGSSVGLFVSVIDLGVPVLLRLSDPRADALPSNIGFRQVLAPGVFGFYHLRGLPLSAFVGTQFTPQLRELSQVTSNEPAGRLNSLRFNVGLTVDIPLFQLFTRNEPRGVVSPSRRQIENQARADEAYCQQLASIAAARTVRGYPNVRLLEQQLDSLNGKLQSWLNQYKLSDTDTGVGPLCLDVAALVTQAQAAAREGKWELLAEKRAAIEKRLAEQLPLLEATFRHKTAEVRKSIGGARQPPVVPVPVLVPPLALPALTN